MWIITVLHQKTVNILNVHLLKIHVHSYAFKLSNIAAMQLENTECQNVQI